MSRRFVAIWFRHLKTDWFAQQEAGLSHLPFVVASKDRGRLLVTGVNGLAEARGIETGMVVADARAIVPNLKVLKDEAATTDLLQLPAEWCIRFTPLVCIDHPDGLILDASGCAHLWGGENYYVDTIYARLSKLGYDVKIGMADTVGCAWAISRFGGQDLVIQGGQELETLRSLPAAALRLDMETTERLEKLGLYRIGSFINMPRSALRRRFGEQLLRRIRQALGQEEELLSPVQPNETYQERLACMEPIITGTGIEIALRRLLEALSHRLQSVQLGIREAILKCYRVDGKIEIIRIGTNRPSHNPGHIYKLFEFHLPGIDPGLGIELFVLEAPRVEEVSAQQTALWENNRGLEDGRLSELLDRLAGKLGQHNFHRYLPAEHHWPERSFKEASGIHEKSTIKWQAPRQRPLRLLPVPEQIEVTAPIPDYPPMLFRHKGVLHKIIKADGPERIEQEWWLQDGQHRDYYSVEDELGQRYWLFRAGHYDIASSYRWYIHGYFP